jgi:hypothetical protein
MTLRHSLQQALDSEKGPWLLAPGDDWAALVARKSMPRPGWMHPLDRRAWDQAMAMAMQRARRERPLELTALPLWWSENEDDDDGHDWKLRLCFVDDEGQVVIDVPLDDPSLHVFARLRCTKVEVSFVSATRAYAPSVKEVDRFPPFALVNSMVRLAVDEVLTSQPLRPLAIPTHVVPPFSCLVRPGFAVDDLDASNRALLERAIAQNTFIPTDGE